MAGMTLAEARTQVLELLDDDNTRWSSANIDVALSSALNSCLLEYTRNGGDRFTEEIETTTTSGGVLDMSSYNPLSVMGVSIKCGNVWIAIPGIDRSDRFIDDSTARSIRVQFVRTLALPTTTTHPIVGIGATEVNTVPAFDNWVCARAASQLKIKDDEASEPLERLEARLRGAIIGMPRIPQARAFPVRRDALLMRPVKWSYSARAQDIYLSLE